MSLLPRSLRLVIPPDQREVLETLISLSQDKKDALFEAIQTSESALIPELLADSLFTKVDLTKQDLRGIVRMLVSLIGTSIQFNVTPEHVAHDVVTQAATEGIGGLQPDSVQVTEFEPYLASLLSLDVPLGVTAKVLDVLVQHRDPFKSARILSDIRTVFSSGPDMQPIAGLIVHNLQVHTHRSQDQPYIVAMDTRDLRILKEVIDRALQKEDSLKEVISKSGLKYLHLD